MKNIDNRKRNKSDLGDDFVAPDGGWGWIVCFASGFSILFVFSPWNSFGIIFQRRFIEIGLTSAQITTIINIQPAVISMLGLFSGPLFRRFSYRQVALFATTSACTGILLATISNSFITYVISLSIIYGCGYGMTNLSASICVNTYFKKKRRKARCFGLTISAFGHAVMPHLANALISEYGLTGTILIFSALCLHAAPFNLLYQPVKWHVKKSKDKLQAIELQNFIPLTKNVQITETENNDGEPKFESEEETQQKKIKLTWYQKCMRFFDFDLITDHTYVILLIGITLAAFTETNFHVLIPFFLSDFGFNSVETATALSCSAICDLLTRCFVPFIADYLNWDNRVFFMIGVGGMTISRLLIAQISQFNLLLSIFAFSGCCRALRVIFMGLVIPDYLPLNRLPAGMGLLSFAIGIFTLLCGPLVGIIRDSKGSSFMLYFLSFISSITVILWTVHMVCSKTKKQEINSKHVETLLEH